MKLFKQAARYGSQALVVVGTSMAMFTQAHAVGTDPISVLLATISLADVAIAIAAIAVVLVAIKLTFKGPDVAARVIRKV